MTPTKSATAAAPVEPLLVPPFTIEAVPGHLDGTSIGICQTCGHPTLKKGSARKARSAIIDHIRGKHPEISLDTSAS